MLSESFLRTAVYRELLILEEQKDREEKPGSPSAEDTVSDRREQRYPGEPPGASSQALSIPRCRALSDVSVDLYTSWSSRYGSIYKNYPDLHIAGDHILSNGDSGCILDTDGEDGPVLLSADIDSSSPPNENPGVLQDEGGAPSVESHTLPSAPFSNSALNSFIEKKMQELYKQCYEEKLTTGGSPHTLLWSAIMHNVHQISLQISQEQNLKAKEAAMQGVSCPTSGGSSEFTTPVLHISSQDGRTRPGALSSNSAFIKSRRAQSNK